MYFTVIIIQKKGICLSKFKFSIFSHFNDDRM